MKLKNNKSVIFTETLTNKGGIEREILTLLKHIDADICAGIYNPNTTFEQFKDYNIKFFLSKKLPAIINALYLRYKFGKINLGGYKKYIFFGSHSIKAARKHHPNLWYCNSPLRYIYDCYQDKIESLNFLLRIVFKIFSYFIRRSDQKCFKNIDIILVNSKNVQKRIEKYYGNYKSIVVYPPVNTKNFRFLGQKDYYLVCSRLSPEKNVDLVVKAFQKMTDKKLWVVGDGPEREKIYNMIKDYENIKYVGSAEGKKLWDVYGSCIAVIYVSRKEDFGIVPIEAMAAGKPCIGSNDGGMKETIIHKKTGLLINPCVEEIIKAVRYITPKRALKMKVACEKRALDFSEFHFINGIKKS